MAPIKTILIGAGERGANSYAPYALLHPDEIQFVAVAEPIRTRRESFAARHHIPAELQFESWEDLLNRPPLGEAALVATQDWQHAPPALAAMRAGYHLLLEKPMATKAEDCRALVETSRETGRQMHICHVLRYTKHIRLMKEIIQSGALGDVVDVDHRENVSFWHMAHSYVRGNWRNSDQSSPMLLAKCCHDLDMLPWVLGQKPVQVASSGGLMHYKAENAPEGAPLRCLDGCPAAQTCPYYAPHIYLEMAPFWYSYSQTATSKAVRWFTQQWIDHPGLVQALKPFYPPLKELVDYHAWPLTVLAENPTRENLQEALRSGPYGRCVYHCDNNVVDHQVVQMLFDRGTTVTLTMHGHSHIEHRSTRIEGTRGRLMGVLGNGGAWLTVEDHRARTKRTYDTSPSLGEGHGGGDFQLMADFVASIQRGGNPPEVLRAAQEALESHLLAFTAEEARLDQKVIRL